MESMQIDYKNPFDLKEALLLGIFFGVVIALIKLSKEFLGDSGVYVVSFISGITDVDAVILGVAEAAGKSVDFATASYAVVIAVVTNNISKLAICYFMGTKELAKTVGTYYFVSSLALVATLLF